MRSLFYLILTFHFFSAYGQKIDTSFYSTKAIGLFEHPWIIKNEIKKTPLEKLMELHKAIQQVDTAMYSYSCFMYLKKDTSRQTAAQFNSYLKIIDLNADKMNDLICLFPCGEEGTCNFFVFLNDGDKYNLSANDLNYFTKIKIENNILQSFLIHQPKCCTYHLLFLNHYELNGTHYTFNSFAMQSLSSPDIFLEEKKLLIADNINLYPAPEIKNNENMWDPEQLKANTEVWILGEKNGFLYVKAPWEGNRHIFGWIKK